MRWVQRSKRQSTRRSNPSRSSAKLTLAVDVGGSKIKAAILSGRGKPLAEPVRIATPYPCTPKVLVRTVVSLASQLGDFHRVSIGFPGVIHEGKVLTAPHFGTGIWRGIDLAGVLERRLRRPVRLRNDAEVHGFSVIAGKGLEFVVTLGTGIGTALYRDGLLAPHLELAHHPLRDNKTYNEYIGERAREAVGNKSWNQRVRYAVSVLRTLLNYDRIYIGGGNARHIRFQLEGDAKIISNDEGMLGGLALWQGDGPWPAARKVD